MREAALTSPVVDVREPRSIWSLLFLLSAFLIVLGARLWLVHENTTPLPFWDQWDAEGAHLIKPWLEGHLKFAAFFAPHNEHRIAVTRLVALGLFLANGQWDAQLEMAFNAVLVAGTAVLIVVALRRIFPRPQRLAISVLVVLLFSLPFPWENTLAGFGSQFYFLFIFSLLALWGFCLATPYSVAWWIGLASACLACVSMSSGFMVALAVIGLFALRFAGQRRPFIRGDLVTAVICVVIATIGLATRVTVPGHANLRAVSLGAFITALGRGLAWPLVNVAPLALVLQVPLLVLFYKYLSRARKEPEVWGNRRIELLLATGLWVWLQAAAIAYVRGGVGYAPVSRYQDLLSLGALINFLCLAVLLRPTKESGDAPTFPYQRTFAAVWLVLLIGGLISLTSQNFRSDIKSRKKYLFAQEKNVRGYLATGDYDGHLANKPFLRIPYPDPVILQKYLDDPTLRRTLPSDVLPSNGIGPWSYWSAKLLKQGSLIFLLGVASSLVFAPLSERRRSSDLNS